MDTSKKMAEQAAEIFSANEPKNEDYYKIWDSWGMTKEEWKALEAKESLEARRLKADEAFVNRTLFLKATKPKGTTKVYSIGTVGQSKGVQHV